MKHTLATVALAGALGLTGLVLVTPGSALAQAADGSSRLGAVADALKGLVTDGTLTQTQADKVASTLAEVAPGHGPHHGPGGRGGRGIGKVAQEEVAKALGITVEQLRTEREAGRTLAQIAEAKGIEKAHLIADLLAAAKTRLAQAVTDGRITQERADVVSGDLEARITELVDRVGHGPGGHHRRHHGFPEGTAPSTAASPSVESSST